MCTGASIERLRPPTALANYVLYRHSFFFQMLYLCIIGILSGKLVKADRYEEIRDENFKSEIETAVAESESLANDLANMLARMERRDDKSGILTKMSRHKLAMNKQMNTEQTISFPESDSLTNNRVSKAVQAMASIIHKLSTSTGDSDESQLTSLTIEQLQFVASQVEEVSSFYDVDTVEEMLNLLKSISDKLELMFKEIKRTVLKGNRTEESVKIRELGVDEEKVSNGQNYSLGISLNTRKSVQQRIPIDLKDKEPEVNCRRIPAANHVQVCVPKVSTAFTQVNFLNGFVQEDQHCYDM